MLTHVSVSPNFKSMAKLIAFFYMPTQRGRAIDAKGAVRKRVIYLAIGRLRQKMHNFISAKCNILRLCVDIAVRVERWRFLSIFHVIQVSLSSRRL